MGKRKGNKKQPFAKASSQTAPSTRPTQSAAQSSDASAPRRSAVARSSGNPGVPAKGTAYQQGLDQRRARHAWETVERAAAGEKTKDFAGHAKKLPMRIRAAGLGQALAFVAAKGELGSEKTQNHNPALKTLLVQLNDWVLDRRGLRDGSDPGDPLALLREITARDAAFLKRATMETMGWLQWVNRFAEAKGLKGEEDGDTP